MQWLDNKPVTFLSTVHKKANPYVYFQRHVKVNRQYRPVHVRQPKLVRDYNTNMSGVNKSDQLINKYDTLRKTHRWWKTLFFHFVDAARVNSFVLFNVLRAKYLDIAKLQRPKTYNQLGLHSGTDQRDRRGAKGSRCATVSGQTTTTSSIYYKSSNHPNPWQKPQLHIVLGQNRRKKDNCEVWHLR